MAFEGIYQLVGISIVFVLGILVDKASNGNQRFPRVILLIIGGFLLGLIADGTNLRIFIDPIHDIEFVEFIAELALSLVLFREGLELNLQSFARHLKTVLLLATIGLIITTIIFAGTIALLTPIPFLMALLIAGILAPTDPAATFSIFKGGLHINAKEKRIIGSESALNDAVAIVLATTVFLESVIRNRFTFDRFVIIDIITSFFGGIFLGYLLAILFLRINDNLDHWTQRNFVSLSLVLLSFSLSMLLHGILEISAAITALTAGAIFGNPQRFGSPRFSLQHMHEFQRNVSEMGELLAFTTIGMLISTKEPGLSLLFGFLFAIVIIFARLIAIGGIMRYPAKLSLRESTFISWAGMRGLATGVLAMIAYINLENSFQDTFSGSVFLNSIMISLVITSLIQGLSLKKVGEKTYSVKFADKKAELRAERRLITSQLAYYRKKLEANKILKPDYDGLTLPLRDKLTEIVNLIENEKKKEVDRLNDLIDEFDLVSSLLDDAIEYKNLLIRSGREVFFIDEKIEELEDREEVKMDEILVALDIFKLRYEAAIRQSDSERKEEISDIFRMASNELNMINETYESIRSEKICASINSIMKMVDPDTDEIED